MGRYTKAQLEEFFYRQYEYIEALAAQLNLVKEQNELLKKENGLLKEKVEDYKSKRRPTSIKT